MKTTSCVTFPRKDAEDLFAFDDVALCDHVSTAEFHWLSARLLDSCETSIKRTPSEPSQLSA